jgi:hypothetical protein
MDIKRKIINVQISECLSGKVIAASEKYSIDSKVLITAAIERLLNDFEFDEKDTFGAGFSFKQLYDYLENWESLIRNNERQKETERLKAERRKVLADACACITYLEKTVNEIAGLKSKIKTS